MSIFQLSSSNQNFSHIISKNPASGMIIKTLRKGKCFGWFSENNNFSNYNCYFKDADNEISYSDSEFEYMDTTRYNSSIFINNVINDYFNSCVKKQHELDIDNCGTNKCMINMFICKGVHYLTFFQQFFTDYKFTFEEIAKNCYKLEIETNKSIYSLLNLMNVLGMINSIHNKEMYMDINDDIIQKFIKSINIIKSPYFIRYLFKINFLRESQSKFKRFKLQLDNDNIQMEFGGTQLMRRNWVESKLTFNNNIFDFGCGEGFYTLTFAKKLKEKTNNKIVIAYDTDLNCLDYVNKKALLKQLDNIHVTNQNNLSLETEDVILIEVLEHMTLEEAKQTLKALFNQQLNSYIITTPNKDFNEFYKFTDDQTRHEDHKFELTHEEFKTLIIDLVNIESNNSYICEFEHVGDKINGISPTSGCIIKKAK